MNKRNDINEIKNQIKELIYRKNITVFNVILGSDMTKMKSVIDSKQFRYFSIPKDEFRKFDKKTVVNGKRIWLKDTVIKEMIDNGELIEVKSYSNMSYNSYAKMYPLTIERFLDIKDKYMPFETTKKIISAENEWTANDPFVDECDWPKTELEQSTLTEMFEDAYSLKRKAKFENDCKMLDNKHKYMLKYFVLEDIDSIKDNWTLCSLEKFFRKYKKAITDWSKENA